MAEGAFPVVYAGDVERSVRFYAGLLGFHEHFRLPAEGEAGYVGLERAGSRLGIVTTRSPQELLGLAVGSGPRFELFVYVDDVDAAVARMRDAGVPVLRDPADMPWGERVAHVADPDGNPVALAAAAA
jgi:lactoylglutathione lyase